VPVFELTYPEGALDPETREQLLDDLTTAVLRAERAPDTEFFRSITWSYVHELPAGSVRVGGRPVERPSFKIDVTTPQGGLSDSRRQEFIEEATRLIRAAAGIGEGDALRIWVLMHEVAEGSWGAGGRVIHSEQLRRAAQAEREKTEPGAPA